MRSFDWYWVALLIGAGLFAVVVRNQELGYRRVGLRTARSKRFIGVSVLTAGVLWSLIAWLLWWPLWGISMHGTGGRVTLAVLGGLLGLLGAPDIGLGAAVTYTFWRPAPMLLAWWALPILAAYLARWLLFGRRRREQRMDPERSFNRYLRRELQQVRRLNRYGLDPAGHGLIRPPERADRGWRYAYLAVGALPLLGAFLLPFPIASQETWLLRLGCGLLIAGQVWLFGWAVEPLTRYFRRGARVGQVAYIVAVLIVAATPLGRGLVTAWRTVPWLTGYAGGLALGAIALLGVLGMRSIARGGRLGCLAMGLAGGVVEYAFSRGLLPFALAGLFHPDEQLLQAAAVLVAVQALMLAFGVFGWRLEGLRVRDAAQLVRFDAKQREDVLGCWLYDAFLRQPGRPDHSLVNVLGSLALSSAHSHLVPGQSYLTSDPRLRRPLTGQAALRWIELAEQALGLVETEVFGRYPSQFLPKLQHCQELARARCALSKANIYQYLNWRDEALNAWRAAGGAFEQAGLRNLAASAYANAALLLATLLGRPVEANQELAAWLADERLAPVIRRFLSTIAAMATAETGSQKQAEALLAEARTIPVRPRDLRNVFREGRIGFAPLAGRRRERQGMARLFHQQDVMAAVLVLGEDVEIPSLPSTMDFPARRLTRRAAAFERAGKVVQARRMLAEAAELAARDGHLTWVVNAHYQLASLADDPVESHRHFVRAVDALEEVRGRVLDPDLRIGASSSATSVYEHAALNLVMGGQQDGEDWPAQPNAAAFQFAEQARSRVFLEMLGERVSLDLPAELGPLAAAEVDAVAAYDAELAALDSVAEEDRGDALARVREAHGRVEMAWRALERVDAAGVEYADLRRGSPRPFDEVRGMLADIGPAGGGAVLAEYLITNAGTVLFLVRPDRDEPEIVLLDVAREDLREATAVSFGHGDMAQLDLATWDEPFRPLVEPLRQRCTKGELVWLVPHDILHRVPLHAVKVDGRALIEDNPVCYTPSASVMRYCRTKGSGRLQSALVLADSRADMPLVHARVQALAIGRLFGTSKVCIGEAASENAVDSGLTNDGVDVLHLACHGVFDLADAMGSGVLLAPDGARDSVDQRLTARDLLRLRMRTELVTLSACESGLSEQRPGEELVGLTRALIYAGAPSVVVSLWSVDEISTSMLMEAFYRSLLAGASKALALQEAQTSLRHASLRDVITHCEVAMGHPDLAGMPEVVATLDQDVADARYRAGDFAAALTSYSRLLEQVPVSSPTHAVLLAAAARCRAAMRGSDAIAADYDRRPFEHPYYWAPFVLVGDWR